MEEEKDVEKIIENMNELVEDSSVPKNIKENVEKIIKILKEDGDISIRISKALNCLDEISDDINMQPYTRTQIWNIVSMLEKVIS